MQALYIFLHFLFGTTLTDHWYISIFKTCIEVALLQYKFWKTYPVYLVFSDWLHRSHIMQHCCGCCKLKYLCGYYESTLTEVTVTEFTVHVAVAECPNSILKGTQTCSSLNGTVLYETHAAKSGIVNLDSYTSYFNIKQHLLIRNLVIHATPTGGGAQYNCCLGNILV